MSHSNPRTHGFTLLELMVTLAVSLIIVGSALMAAQSFLTSQYGQTRKNELDIQIAMGQVILDRALTNAGAVFPDARYAVHIRPNVVAGTTLPGGTGSAPAPVPVTTFGSASAGILEGTDVIEVAYRSPISKAPARGVGTVQTVLTGAVRLTSNDPFLAGEGVAPVLTLLFTDSQGTGCLASVTSWDGISQAGVTWLNDDYASTAVSATCPVVGMSVYALDTRQRFMIYQTAGGQGLGLYLQDNLTAGVPDLTGAFGPPKLVAGGVEDLQVMERIINTNSTCGTPYCTCDDSPTPSCVVDSNHVSLQEAVRGFNITLVGKGNQSVRLSGGRRPAVYDHAAGPTDNLFHAVGEQSLYAINLALTNL